MKELKQQKTELSIEIIKEEMTKPTISAEVTKSKAAFPNDDSLLKMLYLAQVDITRNRTGRRRVWGEIHSQSEIFFADRFLLICK